MLFALLHLHCGDRKDRMYHLEDVLFNAMDGNALYEIERASQLLRDDQAECAYYTRHNPIAAP